LGAIRVTATTTSGWHDQDRPCRRPLGRAGDHGEFLGHVEAEHVGLGRTTALRVFARIGNNLEVPVLNESIGRDLVGDPVGEEHADAQEGVKAPGVHGVDGQVADDLGATGVIPEDSGHHCCRF